MVPQENSSVSRIHRSSNQRSAGCNSRARRLMGSWSELLASVPRDRLGIAVEAGILAVLFVCPLFMGGRHPLGRLVFVTVVFVTAFASVLRKLWSPDQTLRISHAAIIPLLGLVLVILQLVSFPPDILRHISPHQESLLPVWTAGGPLLTRWQMPSLSPRETQISLAVYLSYFVLWIVVSDRLRSIGDCKRFVKLVALSAFFMAALAIFQYVASNGRFLWVYAHPFREPSDAASGAFANANHLAHFATLGIAPILWILWETVSNGQGTRRSSQARFKLERDFAIRLAGICLGLIVCVLAVCLSLSRGGLVMMLLSIAVFLSVGIYLRRLNRNWIIVLSTVGIICVAALALHGWGKVGGQMQTLSLNRIASDRSLAARRDLWQAVIRGSKCFGRFGVGAGAHQDVYPAFLDKPSHVTYTHAESSLLQVLFEMGIPGLTLVVAGILVIGIAGYFAMRSHRSKRSTGLMAGCVVASISVILVHAVFDFIWHIPACMTLSIMLIAVLLRLAGCNFATMELQLRRPYWAVVAIGVCCLGVSNVQLLAGPALASQYWDDYLVHSLATNQDFQASTKRGRLREIGYIPHDSEHAMEVMTRSLEKVLRHDPQDARAHGRLASLSLQTFDRVQSDSDNPMVLSQLRDAAHASRFNSREGLHQWLNRALGANKRLLDRARYHAIHSIQLCPMAGDSYLYLAEVAFLDSRKEKTRSRLLQQTRRIRPTNGAVMFALGQDLATQGDINAAFAKWRAAFHLSSEYRNKLIESLTDYIAPDVLLEQLSPDLTALKKLFHHYRHDQNMDGQIAVASYADQIASVPGSHVDFDSAVFISDMLEEAGRHENAIHHLYYAANLNPHDYGLRIRLARQELRLGNFVDAEKHLRWCQRRKMRDPRVASMLKTTLRGSVKSNFPRIER